jgi:hypothetical protein
MLLLNVLQNPGSTASGGSLQPLVFNLFWTNPGLRKWAADRRDTSRGARRYGDNYDVLGRVSGSDSSFEASSSDISPGLAQPTKIA